MIINVLMSTYNGEKYLKEQIDSIMNQRGDFEVRLYVRDDGSIDATHKILEEYSKQNKLTWYKGENIKPARSFWKLLSLCEKADYYAFCDQDDVWNEDKLKEAIKKCNENEDKEVPFLYCSDVEVVDSKLNTIECKVATRKAPTFAHSLIYSLAPGCTFVMNHKAREKALEYDIESNYVLIHDWLVHKIIAMFGKVYFDDTKTMQYRQHGNNVIGAQSNFKAKINRIKRFLFANDNARSNSAKALLKVYGSQVSGKNKELLEMVANYTKDKKMKEKFLKEESFKIGGISDLYFKLLVRLNKI